MPKKRPFYKKIAVAYNPDKEPAREQWLRLQRWLNRRRLRTGPDSSGVHSKSSSGDVRGRWGDREYTDRFHRLQPGGVRPDRSPGRRRDAHISHLPAQLVPAAAGGSDIGSDRD